MANALERIRRQASEAVQEGYNVIVLSDKPIDSDHAAILRCAVAAVHHHLIREGTRSQCGIIIETGEAREVHHFACCSATAPAPQSLPGLREHRGTCAARLLKGRSDAGEGAVPAHQVGQQGPAQGHFQDGHLHHPVLYRRRRFRAVGLHATWWNEYFTGTVSRLGGVDLATLEEETLLRHRFAYRGNGR